MIIALAGKTNKSISVGYNGGFRNVNYYLGYSYNRYTWSGNNSGKDAQDDQRISLTVTLPTSKGVIASRLNLTQEHFSRILHELSEKGLILVKGRKISIPDVEKLRTYDR